jgi:hypothetical protein
MLTSFAPRAPLLTDMAGSARVVKTASPALIGSSQLPRPGGRARASVVATCFLTFGVSHRERRCLNPNGHTAAPHSAVRPHVTVTNPRNGNSITVVINDRGPFVKGVTSIFPRRRHRHEEHAMGLHV